MFRRAKRIRSSPLAGDPDIALDERMPALPAIATPRPSSGVVPAMERIHPDLGYSQPDFPIRTVHAFWRSFYITMLAERPPGEVLGFFADKPFTMDGRDYSGAALFEHLWSPSGKVPMDWNLNCAGLIERFLLSKGADAPAFIRKMFRHNNRSTWIPGRQLLAWIFPVVGAFLDREDLRDTLFRVMELFARKYLPGGTHHRIKKEIRGEWIDSYVMLACDTTFSRIFETDLDFMIGEQYQAFPGVFNLPPWEEVHFLADCRAPERVLWEGDRRGGPAGFELDGRRLGVPASFHAFLGRYGVDPQVAGVPDATVTEILEDVACPLRRRVVLRAGSVYGAPVYITRLRHRQIRPRARSLLPLLGDLADEENPSEGRLEERHRNLLQRVRGAPLYAYYHSTDSISLDGRHLVKGVPAKILRDMLRAHVREGKVEFDYIDFKRDEEISLGRKRFGLDIRVARLMEKLEREGAGLRLAKVGRGRVRLEPPGPLQFREE